MSQNLHIQAAEAHQANNITKAKSLYIEALKISPDFAESWNNLGVIFKQDRELIPALMATKRAVALDNKNASYLINLGLLYWNLKQYKKAEFYLDQAVEIDPDLSSTPWHTLSYIKWIRGDNALPDMTKALSLAPQSPELTWDKALINLSMGNFEEGWIGYEARFANPVFNYLNMIQFPMWRGEDLSDKKLYLHAEQGLGDIIQIVRFVHQLVPLVKKIRFDVPNELRRLLEHSFKDSGIEFKIMYQDELPNDCDYHLPLGSLPLLLGSTFETLSAEPYLTVPSGGIPIKRKHKNKAVGIIWAGDKKHENDKERSANFLDFVENLAVPGIDLYPIQFGERASDIAISGLSGLIPDYSGQIRDMADNASIMQQLDCIVTVDTASAHLAGAIGVPFHVITPYHLTDWRWMINRSDSPWYRSATIHRQNEGESYKPVLARVAKTILGE